MYDLCFVHLNTSLSQCIYIVNRKFKYSLLTRFAFPVRLQKEPQRLPLKMDYLYAIYFKVKSFGRSLRFDQGAYLKLVSIFE